LSPRHVTNQLRALGAACPRFQGVFGAGNANAGLSAIVFNAGKALIVDNCDITGFSVNGITVAAASGYAGVNNTRIENVANAGVLVTGSGAQVDLNGVRVYVMKFGIAVASGGKANVSNSQFSKGTNGVEADTGGALNLDSNVITYNTTGIAGTGTITSYNNNRLFGNTGNGTTPAFVSATVTNPMGMDGR
jgi:hypothetical protein